MYGRRRGCESFPVANRVHITQTVSGMSVRVLQPGRAPSPFKVDESAIASVGGVGDVGGALEATLSRPATAASAGSGAAGDRQQLYAMPDSHTKSHTSRASAYRPQPVQTRLRARSIGKATLPGPVSGESDAQDTSAAPVRPLLHAQGRTVSDLTRSAGGGGAGGGLSALARQRAEFDARRVKFSEQAPHEYEEAGSRLAGGGGTEESGSARSDSSPPHTPRLEYYDDQDGAVDDEDAPHYWVEQPPSRRGSTHLREEREAWRTGGEPPLHLYDPPIMNRPADLMSTKELHDVAARAAAATTTTTTVAKEDSSAATRNRSKSLEGLTRMSLRRGKSFTSLLVQPALPSPLPTPTSTPATATTDGRDPFLSGAADRAKLSAIAPTPVIAQFEMPPTGPSGRPRADTESTLYPPVTGLDPLSATTTTAASRSLRDFVPQLIILFSLFLSSFVVIALTIATLPGLFLPHSVSDLPQLTKTLTTYRASSFAAELHLFIVLTLLFLWKQCFSIPGSILTNILFGALYGTTLGTWWACLWTATGSTGAYLIAVLIAPLVSWFRVGRPSRELSH